MNSQDIEPQKNVDTTQDQCILEYISLKGVGESK